MLLIRVAIAEAIATNSTLVLKLALTILAPLILVVAIATKIIRSAGEVVVVRYRVAGEETIRN
jgi:hypothetical protein